MMFRVETRGSASPEARNGCKSAATDPWRALIRRILLGSTAGLALASGSRAADLPKTAPAEYVRICDWTGAGFFNIPGTDTCVKVGGQARFEYLGISNGTVFLPGTAGPTGSALSLGTTIPRAVRDATGFSMRGRIETDARTQTTYGTVRAFVRFNIDRYSGSTNSNTTNPAGATVSPSLNKALIQFSGLTFGRMQSAFDFGADPYGFEGVPTSDAATIAMEYTFTLGNGLSATMAVEDPNARRDAIQNTIAVAGATSPAVAYGGDRVPDLVGQLRADEDWGAVQGSVAYHQVDTAGATATQDKAGFAVGAGVLFKLPMLAAGDEFQIEGHYEHGAYSYQDTNGIFGAYSGNYIAPGFYHPSVDAVAIPTATGYSLAQSKGYSVSGGFAHYFTPDISNTIYAGYGRVSYEGAAGAVSWLNGGIGPVSSYRIGDKIVWTPVKDLLIGFSAAYVKINQKIPGAPNDPIAGQAVASIPVGIKANPNAVEGRLRVQRDF